MSAQTPGYPEARWFWGVSPWASPVLALALCVGVWSMMPRMTGNPEAQVLAARVQLRAFERAVNLYARDHGAPPRSTQGLPALLGRYLDNVGTIPKDPWGHPYVYQTSPLHPRGFRILSYGADGKPGGTALNQDLTAPQ